MSAWTWGVVCDNEHGAARELTPAEVQLHGAAPELAVALEAMVREARKLGYSGTVPPIVVEAEKAEAALHAAGRQP